MTTATETPTRAGRPNLNPEQRLDADLHLRSRAADLTRWAKIAFAHQYRSVQDFLRAAAEAFCEVLETPELEASGAVPVEPVPAVEPSPAPSSPGESVYTYTQVRQLVNDNPELLEGWTKPGAAVPTYYQKQDRLRSDLEALRVRREREARAAEEAAMAAARAAEDEVRMDAETARYRAALAERERDPEVALAADIWRAVLGDLTTILPRPTVETWLKGTRGVAWQGDQFIVDVPTAFGVEWLENRLFRLLQRTLDKVAKRPLQLQLQVRESGGVNADP